ncbi:MAG: metalloregulator ArsR/SmtB family transcription factor [Rhodospirillaceae bacterium]
METQLRALADPVRFRIVGHLAGGEAAAGNIARAIGKSGPDTSHHLAVLRDSGLVRFRRDAQARLYSLNEPEIVRFRIAFEAFWAQGLPKLKALVEADHGRRRP